ncbi:UDP-glucose 4-epimerase GalE [Desulfonatronum lacustre]|uniref:UDP-glucose 4-epimerase GalE n=1 Tax=Desulfonatronum lacustre TaxID=66849 RepID=UPI00048C1FDE|nr:UDP-glucose 4-epimerase GalE [Desulfonatronum lacustre]SMP76139.1 UDP-glucose 4-epimerase/UDP-arabinose 4-epimerase [Desulfonatronum zhilinae]
MSDVILVTGGAGYIGSQTCKALAAAGYRPVTLDNLVYGHEWAVRWGELVKGDILDGAVLDALFATHAPKAVIHFAAYAYVGESVTDPQKYYRNNVAGSLSLLEAMLRHGCRRIVFSSTCATYGEPLEIPIPESHPQHPVNPYGWSKLMIEQMLRDFDAAYGLRHVALRYFNAAGADPDGELGEEHDPETHLIPLAVLAAQGKRGPLSVFGRDYPTPDGTAIRDYIHVADLARAHVAALRFLLDEDRSEAFNLGTGSGHSVRQVVDMVREVGGREVPTLDAPRRAGDPPALVAVADKARAVLGWEPSLPRLEDIVRTAWDWHAGPR